MAFNGAGVFVRVRNWVTDKANSVLITASRVDEEDDGFATGLSNTICRDGQSTILANLPMSGYRHTGVGAGTVRTHYADVGSEQDGLFHWCGTSGGSANAHTLTPSPAITAYAAGQLFRFIAGFTNTAATTFAISGLTTKAAQLNGVALAGGEIVTGRTYEVLYDGTALQLFNARDPQIPLWCGTGAGTANAQTATPSPAIVAYQSGGRYTFAAGATNTAATTLAISGLTAKAVQVQGAALAGGEIVSGRIYTVMYDGTQLQLVAGAEMVQGTHEFYVPASGMTPSTTNGSTPTSTETASNKVMQATQAFDQTTSQSCQFSVAMPKGWDLGTVTFKAYYVNIAGSGVASFKLSGVSLSDNDTADTAFGTGVASSSTSNGTTKINVAAESASITIAGTPAAGDITFFKVARDTAVGSNLNATAYLLGVRVRAKFNVGNDA